MEIWYFTEPGQESPVKKYLRNLPNKIEVRIRKSLKCLADNQGRLEGIAFRKLHGYPLEEVRVKESKNLHRIIIKTRIGDKVIVLHGFTKKEGEKTPQKDLDVAYSRYLKLIS